MGLRSFSRCTMAWAAAIPAKRSTLWIREQGTEGKAADKETAVVAFLKAHGASFFQQVHDGVGGGYPGETLNALDQGTGNRRQGCGQGDCRCCVLEGAWGFVLSAGARWRGRRLSRRNAQRSGSGNREQKARLRTRRLPLLRS